ncbi:hypothetical protein TNIN_201831 [Trichonephila inaurata madagascariensis]|uniref:Uncharacterized protein n=1 Tax=Trichonephila inaurata madagascariensis TaxID=2747483 RepID=A0A8X6WV83_9ARAC|nr:hypothetical protein TNIN_201831 [Trichonephila inaurata madagascariensis]
MYVFWLLNFFVVQLYHHHDLRFYDIVHSFSRFSVPRCKRDDICGLRLSDDLHEKVRLQRNWTEFSSGCHIHPVGHHHAECVGHEGLQNRHQHHQVRNISHSMINFDQRVFRIVNEETLT